MPTVDFTAEYDYDAGPYVHLVYVPFRLFTAGQLPLAQRAVLDTGASFSVLDKALAPLIGIDHIESGEPLDLRTANDEPHRAYLHDIQIEFLGFAMTVPVAFVPSWPEGIDNVLGMYGFFDQLDTALLGKQKRLLVGRTSA
jgi:hypothetical protein